MSIKERIYKKTLHVYLVGRTPRRLIVGRDEYTEIMQIPNHPWLFTYTGHGPIPEFMGLELSRSRRQRYLAVLSKEGLVGAAERRKWKKWCKRILI